MPILNDLDKFFMQVGTHKDFLLIFYTFDWRIWAGCVRIVWGVLSIHNKASKVSNHKGFWSLIFTKNLFHYHQAQVAHNSP